MNQVENAYMLPFANELFLSMIVFDGWQHLKCPVIALEEFQRVLIPGGRVTAMEAYMSLLGMLV